MCCCCCYCCCCCCCCCCRQGKWCLPETPAPKRKGAADENTLYLSHHQTELLQVSLRQAISSLERLYPLVQHDDSLPAEAATNAGCQLLPPCTPRVLTSSLGVAAGWNFGFFPFCTGREALRFLTAVAPSPLALATAFFYAVRCTKSTCAYPRCRKGAQVAGNPSWGGRSNCTWTYAPHRLRWVTSVTFYFEHHHVFLVLVMIFHLLEMK